MLVNVKFGWVDLKAVVALNDTTNMLYLNNGDGWHISADDAKLITKLMIQEQGALVYADSIRVSWKRDEMQLVIKDWFQGTLATYFDDEYAFARDLIVSSVQIYGWGEDGIANSYVYIENEEGRTRRIDLKIQGSWHELEMYEHLMFHLQKLVFEDWNKRGFDDDDE